eukprot:NODE_475_length_8011_cov_0.074065.p4 type:complete len:264 gc:universal NODE_475_length_8011_cov_0.074065:2665-3456(+)
MYNSKQRASYFMAHASTIVMWQVALITFLHLFIYPTVVDATDHLKFKIGKPEFLAQSPTTSYSFGDWLFKPNHYGTFPISFKLHSNWIKEYTLAWNRHVVYMAVVYQWGEKTIPEGTHWIDITIGKAFNPLIYGDDEYRKYENSVTIFDKIYQRPQISYSQMVQRAQDLALDSLTSFKVKPLNLTAPAHTNIKMSKTKYPITGLGKKTKKLVKNGRLLLYVNLIPYTGPLVSRVYVLRDNVDWKAKKQAKDDEKEKQETFEDQ